MIAVPVFAPRRYLKRAKPPDVLTGIDTVRQARFEMQQAVHETLHVQAVHHPNGANPEEAGPTEQEIAEADRNRDERDLQLRPERIAGTDHVGTPFLHTRWFPLIEPSKMRPPESAMPRTRDVVDGVGVRVMVSVVRDPRAGRSRAIEDCEENQNLFNNRMEFDGAMRKRAVIADRRAGPAGASHR